MELMDGNKVAKQLKADIATQVQQLTAKGHKAPYLTAILVGTDGASETYVGHKEKDCHEVGFRSQVLRFPATISEADLLAEIEKINHNDDIDGLIVQLPLPKHISETKVLQTINPAKDVDGFTPVNVGRMITGLEAYIPATPDGIMELLKAYQIETAGKHCVVLGRSNIVGRPIANLLSQKGYPGDCTVTICHSRTQNLNEICRTADIIVAAIGIPNFLRADMVKKGVVVVDVGITRSASTETKSGWKLTGDVKFDEVAPHCSYITPVPGGVGPMTRVALLKNTLKAIANRK